MNIQELKLLHESEEPDRIAAFWTDLILLTGTAATFAYWIVLFTRWAVWSLYPLFLICFLAGGIFLYRKGVGQYAIFPRQKASIVLYGIAVLCVVAGIVAIRPDGDDLPHFHRALRAAYRLDEAVPLFVSYYDLKGIPELSGPHTLTSYEFFMALAARAFHIDGITFIHAVGGMFPLFLTPIVYFRLARSLGFTIAQTFWISLLTFCFILLSASSNADWANYTVFRCWVGKCLYTLLLLPLLWHTAVRYAAGASVMELVRLHAVTITGLGLTSSAFFLTPYILLMFFLLYGVVGGFAVQKWKLLLSVCSTLVVPAALAFICLGGHFFPPVPNLSIWVVEHWSRAQHLSLFLGSPWLVVVPASLGIACMMCSKEHRNMTFWSFYCLISFFILLFPFVFELIKLVAKSAAWRLGYVLPMPFMAASACILAWSALRRREILAGSLVCLIVALFVCGKAITYQREYILYSSVTFRQDAVTTEVAKTIARLSHGQEKNALAPTAVLTSAIGIMSPELHFLSIPVVDLHLLPNSIYKDQLEERTMLNKLVNGDDSVDRKRLGGCQLNNDAISFQLPLTWNLAKSAIVRSTISRVLDTTIDFLLKRANQCLCLPLFCSRYTVCDLL